MIVYNILSAKRNIKNKIIWKENSSPKYEFTLHLWEKKEKNGTNKASLCELYELGFLSETSFSIARPNC